MNIPFSLAISNTNPHGVLWNPFGATVPNSVVNTVLDNLTEELQIRYGVKPPIGEVWMTGLTVVSDSDDAKVAVGIYDIDRDTFDLLYPISATIVAGGGVVDQTFGLGDGLLLPCSPVRIPVIKYTPVSGSAIIVGNMAIIPIPNAFGSPAAAAAAAASPSALLSEADGASLLEEATNLPLLAE